MIRDRIILAKGNILEQNTRPKGHREGIWIFIDQISTVFINFLCKGFLDIPTSGQSTKILSLRMFFNDRWILLLVIHIITNTVKSICQQGPISVLSRGIDPIISHISKVVHGRPLQAGTKGTESWEIEKSRCGT